MFKIYLNDIFCLFKWSFVLKKSPCIIIAMFLCYYLSVKPMFLKIHEGVNSSRVQSWQMAAYVFSFVVFCQSCLLKPLTVFGFGLQQQKNLEGYVGFANLPNQVYRKSVKRGFEFTLMVVGEYLLSCLTLCCWPLNFSLYLKWKLIWHLKALITKASNGFFAISNRPFIYFQSFELFIDHFTKNRN